MPRTSGISRYTRNGSYRVKKLPRKKYKRSTYRFMMVILHLYTHENLPYALIQLISLYNVYAPTPHYAPRPFRNRSQKSAPTTGSESVIGAVLQSLNASKRLLAQLVVSGSESLTTNVGLVVVILSAPHTCNLSHSLPTIREASSKVCYLKYHAQ